MRAHIPGLGPVSPLKTQAPRPGRVAWIAKPQAGTE